MPAPSYLTAAAAASPETTTEEAATETTEPVTGEAGMAEAAEELPEGPRAERFARRLEKLDLNGDDVVDGLDKALDLPRAADLTWSIGFTHDLNIGSWGYMASRVNYAYRDESAYTDSNLGFILEQQILDAGLDFYSNDERWVFSLYGRNLLDEVPVPR